MGRKKWQKNAYTGGHKIGPAVGRDAFLVAEGEMLVYYTTLRVLSMPQGRSLRNLSVHKSLVQEE